VYEASTTPVQVVTVASKTPSVELYPTLVTDWLTITHASGQPVRIFDLAGHCLYQTDCETNELIVQGGFLKPGIYLVRVGNQAFKILKR
jgi:hypothetical protein